MALLVIVPPVMNLAYPDPRVYALGCFVIFIALLVDGGLRLRFFARRCDQGSLAGLVYLVLTMASLWLEINCLFLAASGYLICDCYLVKCWVVGGLSRMAYRLEDDVVLE